MQEDTEQLTPEVPTGKRQRTYDRILKVIDALIAAGKPFNQCEVAAAAGVSVGYLVKNPQIRKQVNAAIDTSKLSRLVEPQPQPSQPYIQKLEAEIAQLQTEKVLLQQKLQSPPLILKLRQEIDLWHAQIARDRATQQELEKSIVAATAKVEVLQDLIEVEEGRLEQEIQPHRNGHCNGNQAMPSEAR
jgi:hypothetical protein